jgi:F-type H+-transporting ATPase subunit delta
LTSGVAGRYATALFEIARDGKTLDRLEADIGALKSALAESSDLRNMIHSPIYPRAEQVSAMRAITDRMDLGPDIANTLGLMASNRRLFVVPAMISQIEALIADHRGEVTAEVTAAQALSDEQIRALADALKSGDGRDIKLDVRIDESLIGGLVVQVGSRMIDTSIRTKLAHLQNFMKEVR